MSAKAGEVARESGMYRCEGCDQRIAVYTGAIIGDCPHCGSPSFRTGLAPQPRKLEAALDGIG